MSKARNAGDVAFAESCTELYIIDRARRRRGMQATLRFRSLVRNPLRRSCASKTQNAGDVCGGKVSWNALVLEGFSLSFCKSLVENVRFGSLPSEFWERLVENGRFGRFHSQFLRRSRGFHSQFLRTSHGKHSFWKSSILLSFFESLVENARCGRLHSQLL